MSHNFDAAIIGSGIGGLTCGAFLARQGMRVAVLEKHSQIGGCCQNFYRKSFVFDSSVHSVSMADNGFICGLLKQLGIRDSITTVPNTCTMNIRSPSLRYSLPADLPSLTQALARDFPREKESVAALFSDMQALLAAYKGSIQGGEFQADVVGRPVDFANTTRSYKEYIDGFVRDEKLRYLLCSIWPFSGSSPSYAPVFNALIFIVHALEGSHYVKDGFAKLADALAGVIAENGGEVKTQWPVAGMAVDGRKTARAVVNAAGEELAAGTFVSNISPYLLHRDIIPEPSRNRLWLGRLKNLAPSVSAVAVYLGIEGDAADIVKDNVTFWFGSQNHDEIYGRIQKGPLGEIDHLLIMRPPHADRDSTVTLIYFVRPDAEVNWKKEKKKIAEAMISKSMSILGDFKSRIRVVETASPASFERYTGNTGGAIYGFENVKDLYGQSKLPFTTYLHNLYQVGHWTKVGGGIYNVMTSGYAVANMILHARKKETS